MGKKNLPKELLEYFSQDLGIFFVGAGLSVGSGYPDWSKLLTQLIEKGTDNGRISAEKKAEYETLSKDPTKSLMLAEELKLDLGSLFNRYMEDLFQNSDKVPSINHDYIVKTKGSMIITINYDDLIEKSYNNVYHKHPNIFIYSQSREAANNFWKSRFFILKAHGDAQRDVETLILSQRDYRKTLYKEAGYRSLLQTIFTTKSIFFIGVSMNDPEFNQLLDFLHDSYHGGGPTHYLLMEEEKHLSTYSRRYLDDFNIQTITYNNEKGDYSELTEVLKILSEECPR
jgi:hypothetical protein